jgi:hypothetical protein
VEASTHPPAPVLPQDSSAPCDGVAAVHNNELLLSADRDGNAHLCATAHLRPHFYHECKVRHMPCFNPLFAAMR